MRNTLLRVAHLKFLSLGLVPLLACADGNGTYDHESHHPELSEAEAPLSSAVAVVQRRAAAPGKAVRVTLEVRPSASCQLHPEADTKAERALRLFSDERGVVSFYVERHPKQASTERLLLDCDASDGSSTTYPVEIASELSTSSAASKRSAPAQVSRRRPALKGDLTRLSAAELQAGRYPLRPDPARNPEAYARWLQSVSQEAAILEPEAVEVPGVSHDFQVIEGENWAAMIADNAISGGQFTEVLGGWNVPAVTATPSLFTYSSSWVGLDGGGGASSAILQNGIAHNAQDWSAWLGFPYVVTEYYAWAQYLPGPSQRMTNLTVSPGDVVLVGAWVCNASGTVSTTGGYACFYFENGTTHQVMTYAIAKPAGAHAFVGDTVEWVVERQLVGGSLPPLANFGSFSMPLALANNSAWGTGGYASYGNLTAVDMYNFSQLLAWPSMSTSNPIGIDFHWVASQ